MGLSFSCPFADFDDLDRGLQAVLVRSISFNGRDSEPTIMRTFSSGKMILQGSLSLKGRELETTISIKAPSSGKENKVLVRSVSFKSRVIEEPLKRPDDSSDKTRSMDSGNQRNQAALKLQKVYKSFRTRRQLADCAVLVEQRWWKLLDFAELKRSSISFFDIKKPETAMSRWSRARTRAAKVGKGLSKDKKARKLALQHWLEAIDPRHRYGHNLQFYYAKWLHCESKQPFFYWLDIGDGKEVNLDRCPRSKLQQQCIKYLGPIERVAYEVMIVEEGKFIYKQTGKLLDTTGGLTDAKWIFVLSTSKSLYVGQKSKGTFQHSSFLAGGATLSAGRLVVENGILKAVWPHSGHYLPTEENFQEFMSFLKEHNVDLASVKQNPTEEEGPDKRKTIGLRSNFSLPDLTQDIEELNSKNLVKEEISNGLRSNFSLPDLTQDTEKPKAEEFNNSSNRPVSRWSRGLQAKLTKLEIPKKNDSFQILPAGPSCCTYPADSPLEGYETAEESILTEQEFIVNRQNLEEEDEEPVSKETIIRRINSHRRSKSYQLGQHLTSKWTTGAGPRIGCMRDYPSELRFRVLEQANLSPRSSSHISPKRTPRFSPRVSTPTILCRESSTGRKSSLVLEQVMPSQTVAP